MVTVLASPRDEFHGIHEIRAPLNPAEVDNTPRISESSGQKCFICRDKLAPGFATGHKNANYLIQFIFSHKDKSELIKFQDELTKSCFCIKCSQELDHICNMLEELRNLKVKITQQFQAACTNDKKGVRKGSSQAEKRDHGLRQFILKGIQENSASESGRILRTDNLKSPVRRLSPFVKLVRLKQEPAETSARASLDESNIDSLFDETEHLATDNAGVKLEDPLSSGTADSKHVNVTRKKIKYFSCITCELKFQKFSTYKNHMWKIHKDPKHTFKCDVCEETLPSDKRLRQHLKLIHGQKQQPFQCDLCEFSAVHSSNLSTHAKLVHGKIPDIACSICCKKFFTNVQLEYHMKLKHKTYICSHCSVSFKDVDRLNVHKRRVHGEKLNHSCKMCDFSASFPSRLRKHIRIVHEKTKEFKCDLCELQFASPFQLMNHNEQRIDRLSSLIRKCRNCDQVFQTWKSLSEHMMKVHGEKIQFKCDQCDFVAANPYILKTHIKGVHLNTNFHMCSSCGRQFGTSGDLKRHCRRKHEGVPIAKNYCCDICGKVFENIQRLNTHRTGVHGGDEANVTCELCGFKTNYVSSLQKHIKAIHERSKEYTCHICEKKFSQASNMKRHILTHENALPKKFKCSICSQSFLYKTSLKTHEDAIHIRDPKYMCDICGKGFRAQNYLNVHLRTIHKKFLKQNYKNLEINMEQSNQAINPSQTQTQDGSITTTNVITLTEIELK